MSKFVLVLWTDLPQKKKGECGEYSTTISFSDHMAYSSHE